MKTKMDFKDFVNGIERGNYYPACISGQFMMVGPMWENEGGMVKEEDFMQCERVTTVMNWKIRILPFGSRKRTST